MSKRNRGFIFSLGVVLGLVVVGVVLIVRQQAPQGLPASQRGAGQVLYLAPVDAPEIWQNSVDGNEPRRLTKTGGKVFDYAVSPDGRQIVYSAGNELNGLDLWLMASAGGSLRRLLDCGADHCTGPAFAPDGLKIAYSRRVKAENPGGNTPGLGRVWVMNLQDAGTSPLIADAAVAGQDLSWSRDGTQLAFFDPLASAIHIHRLQGGSDLVLPVRLEKSGGWTNDGKQLVFADYALGEERPIGTLSAVDLKTGLVSPAFTQLELVDFDSPVFDLGGDWMAVAGQAEGEGTARSIWLVSLKENQILRVTNDPQASQGAYHWDSAGKRLIYQEYQLGSSASKPAVYVWDVQTRTAQLVAENAFMPAWIP